jgi:MFS family permease
VKERLWTKDFCLISLASFLVYLVFYGILVVIALYAMQQLGASSSQAGLAAGDFLLAALIARILTGHYLERVGTRHMMLFGLAFYLAAQVLYLAAFNIYLLAAVRFLHGLAFGICATALSTQATALVPRERRGEGMGYFLLSITLASALGPFVGLYVYQNYTFLPLVGLSAVFCAGGLFLAGQVAVLPGAPTPVSAAGRDTGVESYLELKALPISLISFIIYFCYSSLMSFFSAYAAMLDLMQAGQYFFLVYSLAIIISRPPVGKLADRRGYNWVMYPSFVLFAAGLVLLSRLHTPEMMFAAAALLGVGFGTFAAMGQVIAIQNVPKERVGITLSTVLSISELGTGVGPLIIGGLLEVWSFRQLYLVIAGVVVLSLGLYYAGCRKGYILKN